MKKATERVTKRDAFRSLPPQDAIGDALARISVKELERKQRDGYTRKPVKKGEFDLT